MALHQVRVMLPWLPAGSETIRTRFFIGGKWQRGERRQSGRRTGARQTTFEGSIVYFLTDKLLIAVEYRQIPNLLRPLTVAGRDLVKSESDWWDITLAYVVNDHITVGGGYANVGNILNNREDNVWAFQVKYEF